MIDIADPKFDPDELFAKFYNDYGESFTDSNIYFFLRHLCGINIFESARELVPIANALAKLWIEAGYVVMTRPTDMGVEEALTDPITMVLCEVTNEGRAVWRQHEKLSKGKQKSQRPKET